MLLLDSNHNNKKYPTQVLAIAIIWYATLKCDNVTNLSDKFKFEILAIECEFCMQDTSDVECSYGLGVVLDGFCSTALGSKNHELWFQCFIHSRQFAHNLYAKYLVEILRTRVVLFSDWWDICVIWLQRVEFVIEFLLWNMHGFLIVGRAAFLSPIFRIWVAIWFTNLMNITTVLNHHWWYMMQDQQLFALPSNWADTFG